jgi:hypothetical protein
VTTTLVQHLPARLIASGVTAVFGERGGFALPVKLTAPNGAIGQPSHGRLATTRKRDESAVFGRRLKALQVDERLHDAPIQLAHMSDDATMGQFTPSIANEVTAALANASAALRWLSAERPDLEEAKHALDRILKNGNRASEVIHRIRGLIEDRGAPHPFGTSSRIAR